MKRLHVNLSVSDLDDSVRFYAALFNAAPSVLKDDYAKWMLDDPRVNFAVTTRGSVKGVDHLGIQVESKNELDEVYGRLKTASAPIIEQGETTCCYARSEKTWIIDPQGVPWETFLTTGDSPVYGTDNERIAGRGKACCARPAREDAGNKAACCAPADG